MRKPFLGAYYPIKKAIIEWLIFRGINPHKIPKIKGQSDVCKLKATISYLKIS
jgi:hypothetical protein